MGRSWRTCSNKMPTVAFAVSAIVRQEAVLKQRSARRSMFKSISSTPYSKAYWKWDSLGFEKAACGKGYGYVLGKLGQNNSHGLWMWGWVAGIASHHRVNWKRKQGCLYWPRTSCEFCQECCSTLRNLPQSDNSVVINQYKSWFWRTAESFGPVILVLLFWLTTSEAFFSGAGNLHPQPLAPRNQSSSCALRPMATSQACAASSKRPSFWNPLARSFGIPRGKLLVVPLCPKDSSKPSDLPRRVSLPCRMPPITKGFEDTKPEEWFVDQLVFVHSHGYRLGLMTKDPSASTMYIELIDTLCLSVSGPPYAACQQ